MTINLTSVACTVFLLALTMPACSPGDTRDKKKEVELALETYDRLIQKMDADSIALMYTPDGIMGDMATGRVAIRKFLSTFTHVQVLSAHTTSDSVHINGDTAIQTGRYHQVAVVDNHDTIKARGLYSARWVWTKEEGWKIHRMTTTPDNPQ